MARCVRVPKERAEETRRLLLKMGLFDKRFLPMARGGFVYFPVVGKVEGFRTFSAELRTREPRARSLEEALRGELSEKQLRELVKSFDIIGDIAVMEIPKGLERKERKIASALMDVHRNVKVVLKKMGPMEGEFRVRRLKVIGGERRTMTEHREHGCRFLIDIAKAYFSPRLVYERKRIAELVRPGENVLVMFAGVGPFAIVTAKKQPRAKIAAIELNPDAYRHLVENVRLNRVGETVQPVFGDVRKIVPERFAGWADRVLMPLPKGAHEFLNEAFIAARKGATIHFYTFCRIGRHEDAIKTIRAAARKAERKVIVLGVRTVRPYSPDTEQVVVDFRAL